MWKFASIAILVVCLAWAVHCEAQRPPSLKTRFGRSDSDAELFMPDNAPGKRRHDPMTRFGRSADEPEKSILSNGIMEKRSAQRPPSLKTRFGRSESEPESLMQKRAAQRPRATRIRWGRSKNKRSLH